MAKWKTQKIKQPKKAKTKNKTKRNISSDMDTSTEWDSVKNNLPIISNDSIMDTPSASSSSSYRNRYNSTEYKKLIFDKIAIKNRRNKRKQQRINSEIYNACVNVSNNSVSTISVPLFHVNRATSKNYKTLYTELFTKLGEYYLTYSDPGKNWQFIEFYFYMNENQQFCGHVSSPFVEGHIVDIPTGNTALPYDNKLIDYLTKHIQKIIGDANLGAYIKTLLINKHIIRISMDYYAGRSSSQNIFHKDTRQGVGIYTCLTFDINEHQQIAGPELTHFNLYCDVQDVNMQRQVVRPVVYGAYGQIGFNDPILIHSTPYSDEAETTSQLFNENMFIPVEILPSHVNAVYGRSVTGVMRVKPSTKRIKYNPSSATRPNFLRNWFEAFPPSNEGHLTVDYINTYIYGNSANVTTYESYCFDNVKFNNFLAPNPKIVNITKRAPIVTSLNNLNPDMLQNIFENVCDRVKNMG